MARTENVTFRVEPETVDAVGEYARAYDYNTSQAHRQLLLDSLERKGYLEDRDGRSEHLAERLDFIINLSWWSTVGLGLALLAEAITGLAGYTIETLPPTTTLISLAIIAIAANVLAQILRSPEEAIETTHRRLRAVRERLEAI